MPYSYLQKVIVCKSFLFYKQFAIAHRAGRATSKHFFYLSGFITGHMKFYIFFIDQLILNLSFDNLIIEPCNENTNLYFMFLYFLPLKMALNE